MDPAEDTSTAGSPPRALREAVSWVLRALVAAGVVGVVGIDLYHQLRPSADGIPVWLFPAVPVLVTAGPGALLLLVAEAILALRRRVRKTTLMLDAALVAAWLLLWFSHL